ncbi:hypothetical protein FGO68_gene14855 [Halteria grandinella]|uniref:Gustatory receptor n=1 Tax=Halteria grandinella TaxID=5974 RepID=A0A8J8P0G8_HALGN|nr:hypothetical protein FGO68_gene14855 [Halteria grandinella]
MQLLILSTYLAYLWFVIQRDREYRLILKNGGADKKKNTQSGAAVTIAGPSTTPVDSMISATMGNIQRNNSDQPVPSQSTVNNDNSVIMRNSVVMEANKMYQSYMSSNNDPDLQNTIVMHSIDDEDSKPTPTLSQPQIVENVIRRASTGKNYHSRPFLRKFWAYFKQSNPIINTWRYYLRLQPRWTRALYSLIAIELQIIITLVVHERQLMGTNPSPMVTLSTILMTSLTSYCLSYTFLARYLSASIPSSLSDTSRSQREVQKHLKRLRKESRTKQKYLFTLTLVITLITFSQIHTLPTQALKGFVLSIVLMLAVYDVIMALGMTVMHKGAIAEKQWAVKGLQWVERVKVWKVKSPIYYM